MGVYRERPKTDSGDRVVPITEETADILRRYKEEQASDVERRTIRLTKDHMPLDPKKTTVPDYLFTVRGRCDPIYPDTVNRYFKRFGETYGIEDFHPHKLRHTAISIMLENGVPEVTVAAIAGHEDASVTHKIYAHASDDGKLEAIKTLDEAIK